METQDFRKLSPNRDCLYFPYTYSPLPDSGTVYYAQPSILNRTVERGDAIKGDIGMSFVECDSDGMVSLIGKLYIVTIDNVVFETRVVRSNFNAKAIIKISGLNGPNLIYEATYGGGKKRWNDSTEDTSNAPWIFGIPTQDLTVDKIDYGDLITVEIYDPNGSLPRRFKICFNWNILIEFSSQAGNIINLDGISTILLKMHTTDAQVTTLNEI